MKVKPKKSGYYCKQINVFYSLNVLTTENPKLRARGDPKYYKDIEDELRCPISGGQMEFIANINEDLEPNNARLILGMKDYSKSEFEHAKENWGRN